MFFIGVGHSIEEVEMDYSEWLGPDYKEHYDKNLKKTSTLICNHVTPHDSMLLTIYTENAFALDISFKSMPLMGNLANIVDAINIPRSGNEEQRQ